jgi:hypothetical protein
VPAFIETIAALNGELSTVVLELEEQIWATFPSSAAHLFRAAEIARKDYEKTLNALNGLAAHAFGEARHRAEHPAYRGDAIRRAG